MRYIIIILISFFLFGFNTLSAQKYIQKGTTFVENTSNITSKRSKSIETKYTWKDKEGKSHKIYLSKSGRAFVKVTSKKTGKQYNKYLDEKISITLSKEYNITYIPKKSN